MSRPAKEAVAILVEEGFEESELLYPYYRFQEAGFEVKIVGPSKGSNYSGKHGLQVAADLSAKEIRSDDFELLVIPGGRAPDRMRTNEDMVNVVRGFAAAGKPIAAICHGPQMLIEADLVRGKRVTSWKSVATDLKNAGGVFVDSEVVVDGNLITSRAPADLPSFCREALKIVRRERI